MPESRRSLLLALAIAGLTVLVYSCGYDNRFLNYDDDLYITDRPEVLDGLSGEGIVWAFTSTQGANWFPLTRLSWMLDAEVFGVKPRVSHGVSLALHVLNALLLFAAISRLTGRVWPSAFVAAVFAVHPLHVESVAWAAGRKDVLSGLFFMLALLAHERVARGERRLLWGAALAAVFALGLMSKPMLVTLPFVLLLLDAWPLARLTGRSGKLEAAPLARAVLEKLPLFVLAAAASAVTMMAQRAGGALREADGAVWWLRIANAFDSVLAYLVQTIWPSGLAVFYPFPTVAVSWQRMVVAVGVVVGITWLALRERERRPFLTVGWLWFLGMLVPVSGLVQVGQAARADRYTYLPQIGLLLMLAWGGVEVAARWPALAGPLRRVASGAVLVFAYVASLQVEVWRDSRTLFEHALAVTKRNHVAHINLAVELLRAQSYDEAEENLLQAIAIAPRSATAHGLRGEVRAAQGRHREAQKDFEVARRIDPDSARWATGLARARAEEGDLAGAEALLREAVAAHPDAVTAHALLGAVLQRRGDGATAEQSLRRALELTPQLHRVGGRSSVASVHAHLASVLAARGEPAGALHEMDEAVRLDPGNPEFHESRADLLGRMGRKGEAIAAYREALRLGRRSSEVLNNLAWLLATAEDPALRESSQAVVLAQEAVRMSGGRDARVLDTLSVAYGADDQRALALSTARRALAAAEANDQLRLAASIRDRVEELRAPD